MASVPVTDEMVNRFLNWLLPSSVRPDPCVMDQDSRRIGTNLLTADEARQMLRYVLSNLNTVLPKLEDDAIEATQTEASVEEKVSNQKPEGQWQRYASYLLSCARSGEHNPQTFEEFTKPKPGEAIEIHVNTRDENGVSQPLDEKTAVTLGEAAKAIHEHYSPRVTALSERQQNAVNDVCNTIFYHVSDATHRQKLKVCFTLLAELLVQDTDAR